jgi:hypothetical protein
MKTPIGHRREKDNPHSLVEIQLRKMGLIEKVKDNIQIILDIE